MTGEITDKGTELEILIFLLSLMAMSGLLSIISNGMVILAHLKSRKGIFERSIVSLACVDILTGFIGTPLVCCIYYYQCKLLLGHLQLDYINYLDACPGCLNSFFLSKTNINHIDLSNYQWILPNFFKVRKF